MTVQPEIRSKEDLKAIMVDCMFDIEKTCGLMFPEIFYSEFSVLHKEIFDLINKVFNEKTEKNKIAIAAPRGIGKTSIARTLAMRAILFKLCRFVVYISNSATSAEMQTENIKRDLKTNGLVRQFFGNIKSSIKDSNLSIDESFSKQSWTAFGHTFVLPRGAGQQVRGLNWANHRPELVIIDDLESKEEIASAENRKKLKEWFHSDLMKTEDMYGKGCKFIYIDTIKHEDALLVDLLDSPEWHSIQLSICDKNYNSLDPNYMTTEQIKEEVEEHRRTASLDVFFMERMNMPTGGEDAAFRQEYFRYFEDAKDELVIHTTNDKGVEETEKINGRNLLHITIVDPAKTVKMHNAESSIQTIAVDRESRKIFNRYITSERLYPDELYDEMFSQVIRFNSFILGYETTGLNEFIIQPIENECRVRGIHPLLVQLQAKKGVSEKGKIERIRTLVPLYKLGYVYHNRANCGALEQQLLSFPRSKLWDIMDGFAYITFIMDKHAVYFDPMDGDDTPENLEDEYTELLDDRHLEPSEAGYII